MALLPSLPKKPTRPKDDDDPSGRQKELGKARETYAYRYDYPEGVAMAHEVHLKDQFSPRYLAKVAELDLAITANHAASRIAHFMDKDEEEHESLFARVRDKVVSLAPGDLKDHLTTVAHEAAKLLVGQRAESLDAYRGFFGTIAQTPIVAAHDDAKTSDASFAWSRIAGPNPMTLRAIDRMPDHFPVDQARFARAFPAGDSLDAALAEGRAFLTDYADLDGAPQGTMGGYQKHLWASVGLFVCPRMPDGSPGPLTPVAIQREQRPGPDNPIVSPDEGTAWEVAKAALSIADGNLHQAITHLAETHLVMEAVILAAKRNLAPTHPILILLEPHFEFTLALNEVARTNLIAPGGQVDHVLGATLEGSLSVVKKGLSRFRFDERAPRKELAARGVADPSTLPNYPYRDDALLVWDVLEAFVKDYVQLYYADSDVASDPELQAFAAEIEATDGGRLNGVPKLDSNEALVELVTLAIFTASAQHAAVNFPQFPDMGYLPSMPGAGYAPLPSVEGCDEAAYLSMLPPLDQALRQFDVTFQLSNLRDSKLGDYSLLHFRDSRLRGPLKSLRSSLEGVETTIRGRAAERLRPYPYLRPSLIPASIHI